MHIDSFETDFDPKILARGKEYFTDGLVIDLLREGNGYSAQVEGSDLYEVEVRLSEEGEVEETGCDCPYDWGGYCKHQAAVLYAVRERRKREDLAPSPKPRAASKQTDLRTLLLAQPKEVLAEALFSLAERDRTLRQSLLLRFGEQENEIEQSRRLMRASMRSRSFWKYGEVADALESAWLVLDRAEGCAGTDCERAVRLSLVVLPEALDLLSYCDDSNGEVGEVISACTDMIGKAIRTGWHKLPEERQAPLFQFILDEALGTAYDAWEDPRLEILAILTTCCENEVLRNALSQALENLGRRSYEGYGRYHQEAFAKLRLGILERWGSPGGAEQFLMANLSFPSFRKQAIDRAMHRKDFPAALALAQDGLHVDREYAGLVHDWRIAAYRAYEAMGDGENILKLAEHFLIHERDGFAYYPVIKSACPPGAWPQKLEELLAAFEAERVASNVLVDVLLAEGQFGRLLDFCRKHIGLLPSLAGKFPQAYKEAVADLYSQLIFHRAQGANTRGHYKEVCDLLRRLGNDVDALRMRQVAQELKSKFSRRPAFQEELGKVAT